MIIIKLSIINLIVILFCLLVLFSSKYYIKRAIVSRSNYNKAKKNAELILSSINLGKEDNIKIDKIKSITGIDVIEGNNYINNPVVISIENNEIKSLYSVYNSHVVHWDKTKGWSNEQMET